MRRYHANTVIKYATARTRFERIGTDFNRKTGEEYKYCRHVFRTIMQKIPYPIRLPKYSDAPAKMIAKINISLGSSTRLIIGRSGMDIRSPLSSHTSL